MKQFPLKIVTPDGPVYMGQAQMLTVPAITGELGIQAGHCNMVAPLGMGQAMILADGLVRYGACIGGMVTVAKGSVMLVPTTFEWAEQINVSRAERSKQRAQKVLEDNCATATEIAMAEARLKRAKVRMSVAAYKPK